jgi:hypothetical protein
VEHIAGLDDYRCPQHRISGTGTAERYLPGKKASKILTENYSKGASSNVGTGYGGYGNYQGYDFRNAYCNGVPNTLNGAGQSIGLFEVDGFYPVDITNYELSSTPTLPAAQPQTVLVDGYSGTVVDAGANMEVSLDIEVAMAMAPGATIVSYEGPSSDPGLPPDRGANFQTTADDILNAMATPIRCRQISCSWFGFGDSFDQGVFAQFAAQGQAFFEASGDTGAMAAGDYYGGIQPPDFISPYLVEVGGTQLSTNGAIYLSEKTWNDGGASGGGICNGNSSYPLVTPSMTTTPAESPFTYTPLAIPIYQSPVSMANNGGSTQWRNIPDVAMIADNFVIASQNGYIIQPIEGTSGAAPLWAAFEALVNQQAAIQGEMPLGFPNPALYAIGQSASYNTNFHDIADGSNNDYNSNEPVYYTAVTGYDLTTGWGSPNGMAMINALVGTIATPTPSYTKTPTPSRTPTLTVSATRSPSFTRSPSPTLTATLTPSGTRTATPTRSPTLTASATRTASFTRSPTPTASATRTASFTRSPTPTASSSRTPSWTPSPTPTPSLTASSTSTISPSQTPSPSASATETITQTFTPAATLTPAACCASGAIWQTDTTTAAFGQRQWVATTVFKNQMWAIGGNKNDATFADVWSSPNGKDWSLIQGNAPFGIRYTGALTFDPQDGNGPRLWVIGGGSYPTWQFNDVWSSLDGATWTEVTANAGFPAGNTGSLVYAGKMWVMGMDGSVWSSSNGSTWTQASSAAGWANDAPHAVVYNGAMWVVADTGTADTVWTSTTGSTWTQVPMTNAFPYRSRFVLTAVCGQLWVTSGYAYNGGFTYFRDVWTSTDGGNWFSVPQTSGYAPRTGASGLVFNNTTWLIGGSNAGTFFAEVDNDVCDIPTPTMTPAATLTPATCCSSGATWNLDTASAAFGNRSFFGSAVFNNKIWVVGGINYPTGNKADIWSSVNGFTWTQANAAAPFGSRYAPQLLAYGSDLWMIGGSGNNDVWNSPDGATWNQVTASATFPPRSGFQSVVYNGAMWVIAGGGLNDVWSSTDGATWTEVTAHAAFPVRSNFGATVFNGQMWVIGGAGSGGMLNDVWSSSDGATWTQATAGAPFPIRENLAVTAQCGQLWVMSGRGTGTGYYPPFYSDVWTSPDGANWTEATANEGYINKEGAGALAFNNTVWLMGGDNPGHGPASVINAICDSGTLTPGALAAAKADARLNPKTPEPFTNRKGILATFPNPGRDRILASFNVAYPGTVVLALADVTGNQVRRWPLGTLAAGEQQTWLDTSSLATGLYFLSLQLDTGSGPTLQALFKVAILR